MNVYKTSDYRTNLYCVDERLTSTPSTPGSFGWLCSVVTCVPPHSTSPQAGREKDATGRLECAFSLFCSFTVRSLPEKVPSGKLSDILRRILRVNTRLLICSSQGGESPPVFLQRNHLVRRVRSERLIQIGEASHLHSLYCVDRLTVCRFG